MKITISGTPGSGKSTVAKLVAKELKFNHFSAGDFMGDMAIEQGISLLELSKKAEEDPEIDKKIDGWTEAIGEADDNFVMDSRLAFNFINDSIKIFLTVSDSEAAKRIFKDKRLDEKENISQDATYEGIKTRRASEKERYQKYYDLDIENEDNYDIVIDTTEITAKEVVRQIIHFIKNRGKKENDSQKE